MGAAMRTIGLIGSGLLGRTLARLAVGAGFDVILSNSRGPETLSELVGELGERARAGTPEVAAESGDVIIAAIPLRSYQRLPVTALTDKTVIDTMNLYPPRDGDIEELNGGEVTSSTLVQRHLVESKVVKAFNNLGFYQLYTLAGPPKGQGRSALPIASDHDDAKQEVAQLMDAMGFDAVDIGTLADSWRSEPNTPASGQAYLPVRPEGMAPEELRRWIFETPGVPVPADRLRELIHQAQRAPRSHGAGGNTG